MSTDAPKIIDALPYIDSLIDDDEDKRLDAMKEVDDAMEVFPPERDYLDYLPAVESRRFKTPMIDHEHLCIERNEVRPPSSNLTMIHVEVPSTGSDDLDVTANQKCLDQLKIKMEYRQRQLVNLELMKTYGEPVWEQYISDHEKISAKLLEEIEDLDKKTREVNFNRKTLQERTLKTLDVLKNEWTSLANKNQILAKELKKIT